jgi:hypothetical protein
MYGCDFSWYLLTNSAQADSNSSAASTVLISLWNSDRKALFFVHSGPRHSFDFSRTCHLHHLCEVLGMAFLNRNFHSSALVCKKKIHHEPIQFLLHDTNLISVVSPEPSKPFTFLITCEYCSRWNTTHHSDKLRENPFEDVNLLVPNHHSGKNDACRSGYLHGQTTQKACHTSLSCMLCQMLLHLQWIYIALC